MLTPFPQIFENINKSQFIFYVEMPERNKSYFGYPCDFMIECSNCLEWFHKSCKK